MKPTLALFLVRSVGVVLLVGVIAVVAYLYQDNRRSERFTADTQPLSRRGPDVVSPAPSAGELEESALSAYVQRIRSVYDKHNDAWCRGDGDAYASVFTADADYISFDGTYTIGRHEIARSHRDLFDRYLQNACLKGAIERIKFLSGDTAVVYVISGTRFDNRQLIRRPSIQTYIAVRHSNRWLFSSFHNGRIDPVHKWDPLRLAWLGIKTRAFRR